jgi:hypothetical protein
MSTGEIAQNHHCDQCNSAVYLQLIKCNIKRGSAGYSSAGQASERCADAQFSSLHKGLSIHYPLMKDAFKTTTHGRNRLNNSIQVERREIWLRCNMSMLTITPRSA